MLSRRELLKRAMVTTAAGLLVPKEALADEAKKIWAFPTNPLAKPEPLYVPTTTSMIVEDVMDIGDYPVRNTRLWHGIEIASPSGGVARIRRTPDGPIVYETIVLPGQRTRVDFWPFPLVADQLFVDVETMHLDGAPGPSTLVGVRDEHRDVSVSTFFTDNGMHSIMSCVDHEQAVGNSFQLGRFMPGNYDPSGHDVSLGATYMFFREQGNEDDAILVATEDE